MHVLALDTTTLEGSVAIVRDDRVLVEQSGDMSHTHAERLPGDLLRALAASNLKLSDIDVFAVAAGPGSFTGLRIGIAAMQGLAFVTGKPIVAVSVLRALGEVASQDLAQGAVVGAWLDAHRHEVFGALFAVRGSTPYAVDRLEELDAATVATPAATLAGWRSEGHVPEVVAGNGAILYADVLGTSVRVFGHPALAPAVGRLGVSLAGAGAAVDPALVQPIYVRRPDAELARERDSAAPKQPTGRR